MQRKIIFIVIVLVLGISASYAEDRATGHWEGHIEIPGQPIAVKVNLAIDESDWRGTIDIPAQGAKGLPLSGIHVAEADEGMRVTFSIRGVPGNPTFDGTLQDGVINGTFSQGGVTFGFRLSREIVSGPVRPQEPKPPFPYQIEEVKFQNGPINLAGTLTRCLRAMAHFQRCSLSPVAVYRTETRRYLDTNPFGCLPIT